MVALPRWQDLSTLDSEHGKGVGRALIEAVYDAARRHRAEYVHWLADARDGSAQRTLRDRCGTNGRLILVTGHSPALRPQTSAIPLLARSTKSNVLGLIRRLVRPRSFRRRTVDRSHERQHPASFSQLQFSKAREEQFFVAG